MTSNLQSVLNQAMAQLQGMNFGSGTFGTQGSGSSKSSYVNSIFGLVQQGQQAIEGNDEQKARATVNIIQGLLSLISLGGNHQAEANQEVNRNSQDITNTENAADKKAQEIQSKIEEITNNIASNTQNINSAIEEIEKLGGNTSKIKEIQEQILEQLDIIEQNKKDLNTPDKKEQALAAISTAAATINELVNSMGQMILDMQAEIESQNAIIDENVNSISGLITESAEKISEGATDIQAYIKKDAAAGTKATQITTQGGTDVPTGTAEVTAGEAINSNIFSATFSGGKGIKLIMDGNQRISAGQTRISGGVANLSSVMQGIGKMGNDISSLSDYANAIGKIGEGAIDLVGVYQSKLQPLIDSLGSYNMEAVVAANEALQSEVKELQNGNLPENDKTENEGVEAAEEAPIKKQFKAAFGL